MDKPNELQQRIFAECREILESLSKIQDKEELIQSRPLISGLFERVGFLKISEEKVQVHEANMDLEFADNGNETHNFATQLDEVSSEQDLFVEDEILPVQNDMGDEEMHEIEAVKSLADEPTEVENTDDIIQEKTSENDEQELVLDDINSGSAIDSEPIFNENFDNQSLEKPLTEEISEELILESTISEEVYGRNVEIIEKEAEEEQSDLQTQLSQDRKLHLANIKGLKGGVHSLFDDEEIVQSKTESIMKSNVPLEFMEAEKSKPDFKLDLNDRIAFTQKLFGGSQTELNDTVQTLNSFKTLDEAKEYLSEIYYQRNWKKSEDYAQRLWTLVENKFL